MNDEFLKKHNVRPDVEFVETLYQKIEQPEQRRFGMLLNLPKFNLRRKLASAVVVMGLAVMLVGFSPAVQATLQSWWWSINGVMVGQDDETGHLISVGNEDAVKFQNNQTLLIEAEPSDFETTIDREEAREIGLLDENGEVGELTKVEEQVYLPEISAKQISVGSINDIFPDFILPTNLPEGYELIESEVKLVENVYGKGVRTVWLNENLDAVVYRWGNLTAPALTLYEDENLVEIDSGPANLAASYPVYYQVFQPEETDLEFASLSGRRNGVDFSVSTTDLTLGQNTLLNILPEDPGGSDKADGRYLEIDYFEVSELIGIEEETVIVRLKLTGDGIFSLYWQPYKNSNGRVPLRFGGEGEYELELELPSYPARKIPITLFTTYPNGYEIVTELEVLVPPASPTD